MTTEERARFEILLENIQRNVMVIAEGHVALNERLDRIETKLDRLEVKVDRLEIRMNGLEIRVTALETKVNALDKKVDALDKKVDRVDVRLTALALDSKRRFTQIEAHLGLNGSPSPRSRRRKKAA